MKTSLKTFLTDLYEIDPTLKAHEAEIIPLVEKLLASDPAQEPDTEFVKRLRMQLRERAAELSTPATSGLSKWIYAFGGALSAAVIIPVAFVAMNNMKPAVRIQDSGSPDLFGYSIADAGKNAFGSLSASPDSGMMSETANKGMSFGMGGDGNAVSVSSPEASQGMGMTIEPMPPDASRMDAKMIAPYPMTKYTYVYNGALPELTKTVAVYKRNSVGKSLPLSALGSSLGIGSIDVASFAGLRIETINFSQQKPFGYVLTVNLKDVSVSLDAQWDQWPQSTCQTEACFQSERLKLSDIPPDAQLITIAHTFVKDHGIDVSHYGKPTVDTQWKREYDLAPNKTDAWIPDQIRVFYPLVIDGHTVSDQSGTPYGIAVSVHVKTRKVMNVYGIMSRDYAKSEYEGVSDTKDITEYLSKLDSYPWMPEGDQKDVKTATVTLGEPVFGYTVYQRFENSVYEELLVPSLSFPVKDIQGGDAYFFRRTVIVPLAADMLKDQNGGGMPMPLDNVRAM